ncbi:MAG: hypothetical protein IT368_13150 [Candidatus Hydrogenedentes bacterium]|nr:hypothetical protein [Candidatus Hydrogenedentota bacterium]
MMFKEDERSQSRVGWLVTGGVALPALAILLELYSGAMAEAYLDPMPTITHLLLLITVPIGMLYLIRMVQSPGKAAAPTYFAAGFVTVLSGLYAVAYLPAYPTSILAVPVFGIGLLAFAPCTAFLASLIVSGRLDTVSSQPVRWRALRAGVIIAFLALGGVAGRLALLDHGVRLVSNGDLTRQERGLSCLRWAGVERELFARSLRVGPAQKRWRGLWSQDRLSRDAYGRAYAMLTGKIAEGAEPPWTLWQRPASAMSRAPEILWASE